MSHYFEKKKITVLCCTIILFVPTCRSHLGPFHQHNTSLSPLCRLQIVFVPLFYLFVFLLQNQHVFVFLTGKQFSPSCLNWLFFLPALTRFAPGSQLPVLLLCPSGHGHAACLAHPHKLPSWSWLLLSYFLGVHLWTGLH